MKVLVTGAQGQLGHDVTDALRGTVPDGGRRRALFGPEGDASGGAPNRVPNRVEVWGTDHASLPVERREAVLNAVESFRPDVIVHAAAWTAVDACEADPETAMLVNAIGTRHIAEAARAHGAHLVYISTDYVFDGTSSRPYNEWDDPNPLSVYGRSKLAGERECPDGSTIVRTQWVCGAHGANMAKTVLRLMGAGDGPLQFVDDQHGSPSCTADLASAVATLALDRRPGLFHVTNQGEASWFEFARAVIEAAGGDPTRVEPIATADLVPARPAPRPAYAVLDNAALRMSGFPLLPDWRDALGRLVEVLTTQSSSIASVPAR